jgi:polysaccharide deacetylase family protein (PEP-CTERM system associated)
MVEAFAGSVQRSSWEHWPSRVDANTRRTLDLLEQHNAKATFFFVGWVAERFPALVREVRGRGHELACHSHWHRPVYSLAPQEFREDTRRAKCVIEQASGAPVFGYRAPTWSVTRKSLWALDILSEEGFTYDSSIYPIRHDLYGLPGANRFPYVYRCASGAELREFPPATVRFAGLDLPAAGGGYLRIFPQAYTEWAFWQFENRYRQPLVVYFHPWELDPEQPRIRGKLLSRLRHYTNLTRMHNRLQFLLQNYSFQSFQYFLGAERESNISPQTETTHQSDAFEDRATRKPYSAGVALERLTALKQVPGTSADRNLHETSAIKNGEANIVVLAYHELELCHSTYLYSVPCEQFEDHLRLLNRYRRSAGRDCAGLQVTFDDGHISNLHYALPLLQKHSVPATFFVSVGLIGVSQNLMTWAHLRELVAHGHRVQSHGWSHSLFTHGSAAELERELLHSRLTIEDKLGVAVDSISAPGGRWNRRIVEACARFGYEHLYGSCVWQHSRKNHRVDVKGRLMIRRSTRAAQLESLLNAPGITMLPMRARWLAEETLRFFTGDYGYVRLWRVFAKQHGCKD